MSVPGDAVTHSHHFSPSHPGIWAEEEDAGIQCGWEGLGGATEVQCTECSSWWGKGGAKGGRMGLLLKGILVLLCYTSRLRTSGKSCI